MFHPSVQAQVESEAQVGIAIQVCSALLMQASNSGSFVKFHVYQLNVRNERFLNGLLRYRDHVVLYTLCMPHLGRVSRSRHPRRRRRRQSMP